MEINSSGQMSESVRMLRQFQAHFAVEAQSIREELKGGGIEGPEALKRATDPVVSFHEGVHEDLERYAAKEGIDLASLRLPPRPTEQQENIINPEGKAD